MGIHLMKCVTAAMACGALLLAAQCAKKDDKTAAKKPEAEAARPLPVKAPFDIASYFVPSGWMGDQGTSDHKLLGVDALYKGKPRAGSSNGLCIRLSYSGKDWAGVYWQYPDCNWGENLGRMVTGAKKLTFWASGEQGGEVVEFKAGGSGAGFRHPDTFEAPTGPVVLNRDWEPHEINLGDHPDLSNVVGAFACTLHADKTRPGPVVVYLDAIRFE